MVFRSNKQGALAFLSLGVLALTACSSQNSTRYGGEILGAVCRPVNVPCPPAVVPVQYIQAPQYVVTPQIVSVAAPAPLPAPLPAPVPVPVEPYVEPAPIYEPYVEAEPSPQPYVEPYVEPEPYVPSYRDLPPVDDELIYTGPLLNDCPEGYIKGYGGGDCIPIAVPRK